MNILKKDLAPITEKAWNEIEEQSDRVVQEYLTSRRLADISGPHGIEFGAISTGKLKIPSNQSKEGVQIGIREVVPLLEVRKSFSLDLWELDNASRNADDIELKPLEKAAKQIASFEDLCFYYGFDNSIATGLINVMEDKQVKVKVTPVDFLRTVAEEISVLQQKAVEGPYSIVLPDAVWAKLVSLSSAYPFRLLLEDLIGGKIFTHHTNKEIFLLSQRGGDFELHLGQDISLGYEGSDKKKVNLFYSESFNYQFHNPEAVRILQAQP